MFVLYKYRYIYIINGSLNFNLDSRLWVMTFPGYVQKQGLYCMYIQMYSVCTRGVYLILKFYAYISCGYIEYTYAYRFTICKQTLTMSPDLTLGHTEYFQQKNNVFGSCTIVFRQSRFWLSKGQSREIFGADFLASEGDPWT